MRLVQHVGHRVFDGFYFSHILHFSHTFYTKIIPIITEENNENTIEKQGVYTRVPEVQNLQK
jgi:hypothetical protein